MNHNKGAWIGLFLFTITLPLLAEYTEEPFQILSSRSLAMGGTHTAYTSDMDTLFNNPAGFYAVEPQGTFAEISLGLRGPVFDITDLVIQTLNGDGDFTTILSSSTTQNLLSGLYAGMSLVGPIYFSYVGNGLGLGIFNSTDITFQESAPATLEATIKEDLFFCGGYAFRLPLPKNSNHTLDIGALLKGGLRGQIQVTESYLNLMNLELSLDTILEGPFTFITSIGLDLGILYTYDELVSVGITAMDIFSPAIKKTYHNLGEMIVDNKEPLTDETGKVPIALNFGVGLTPSLGPLDQFISQFALYLDYKDILGLWNNQGNYKNPWLRLGIGLELTLLEILSLRVGLNEGLMAAGMGIDMEIFSMNIAMFGRELGREPGIRSIYNLMLGFEFRY